MIHSTGAAFDIFISKVFQNAFALSPIVNNNILGDRVYAFDDSRSAHKIGHLTVVELPDEILLEGTWNSAMMDADPVEKCVA